MKSFGIGLQDSWHLLFPLTDEAEVDADVTRIICILEQMEEKTAQWGKLSSKARLFWTADLRSSPWQLETCDKNMRDPVKEYQHMQLWKENYLQKSQTLWFRESRHETVSSENGLPAGYPSLKTKRSQWQEPITHRLILGNYARALKKGDKCHRHHWISKEVALKTIGGKCWYEERAARSRGFRDGR